MKLFDGGEVDTQAWRPAGFVKGDIEHADGDDVRGVAGVGCDDECGVGTGAGPLLDEVEGVAWERSLSIHDSSARVVFEIARSYLQLL